MVKIKARKVAYHYAFGHWWNNDQY